MTTYTHLKLICCVALFVLGGICSSSATPPPAKSKTVQEFWRTLEGELGRRWYVAVETDMKQLSTEKIRVYFHVTPDRQLKVIRVVPQKSNDTLTTITLGVLAQVQAPPIPQELLSSPNQLDHDIGFQFQVK